MTLPSWAERALVELDRFKRWVVENGPVLVGGYLAIRRFAAEAKVENWADLDEGEWLAAVELMQADDGVPLAWVPPGEVVKELVAAPDHESRDAVLLDHATAIAAHAAEVLAAVAHDDLEDLRAAVAEAWDTWRGRYPMAAQALAAAAVTSAGEDHRDYQRFSDIRDAADGPRSTPVDEWGVISLRRTALDCAWATAVKRTSDGLPGFNRHATAHRVSPEQYTNANCLRALMLATALTRELQFDLADEWHSTPLGDGLTATPSAIRSSALANLGPAVRKAVDELQGSAISLPGIRQSPERGGVPATAGLYAFWVEPGTLPAVTGPLHPELPIELLYVGGSPSRATSAATMRSRVITHHLDGNTGSSTLRLSLAALLFERESWHPQRRGKVAALEAPDNRELTAWMEQHLSMTFHRALEPWTLKPTVLETTKPALNLERRSPDRSRAIVTAARHRFREKAGR